MRKLLSTTAVVLALAAPAWAQTSDGQADQGQGQKDLRERVETTAMDIDRSNYPLLGEVEGSWSSDSLIGTPIQTADGEVIGEIEGVVFTPDDRIMGVVVDAGDYLGGDSRPVVIDWYAVTVRPDEELLVVDLSEDQLDGAPDYAMSSTWRAEKEAEIPDVAESQPGVVAGEDAQGSETGGGSTDSGAGSSVQ